MTRALLFLLLLLSLPAAAQEDFNSVRRWFSVQPAALGPAPLATNTCAGTGPTLLGMRLDSVRAFRISIRPDAGCSLTGSGTIRVWGYDFGDNQWGINSRLFRTISAQDAGPNPVRFEDQQTIVKTGCIYLQADNIGVTCGQVTLMLTAWSGVL